VSGAFAAYRKSALQSVGGYDAHNLVEDYELIHRLHRYSDDQGMNWQILVVPQARATTDAPDSVFKFLKQRQRWFAGFLQTQFANSDMIGNPKYRIGRFMLIVKSFDTLQPIFGLVAASILILSLLRGLRIAGPLLILIFAKIFIDLVFHFWSVYVYYRWRNQKVTDAMWFRAALATIFEPFSFQILRHLGAAFGWVAFLRKNREWTPQRSSLERPEAARVPDRNP
jgi:cellulose synthase/poly-beta-1,6-N-acetylglucosamine synthase-like glycosyltransferase